MFELGMRADRDDVVERVNYSPRAGAAVSLLPEGRGILRGGFGKFAERTPLDRRRVRAVRGADRHAIRGRWRVRSGRR